MAFNLVRNSRVFFTSNVDSTTGVVAATGFDATNTVEIQVLDGFSYSQNTNAETVTLSEAGGDPVRGQRSFNTSLAPVDFSFSTYIRPDVVSSEVVAEESVLWNALLGTEELGSVIDLTGVTGATYAHTTGILTISGTGMTYSGATVGANVNISGVTTTSPAAASVNLNGAATILTLSATDCTFQLHNPYVIANGTPTAVTVSAIAATVKLFTAAWATFGTNFSYASAARSNKNQLQKFGMVFMTDSSTYIVDNCALNQAVIDFGLDAIAMVAWTGQGTRLRETTLTAVSGTFGGDFTGTYAEKNSSANFITNKLSTVSLLTREAINGGAIGAAYTVALTGGSITINNNISYITPANLGIVNIPITYYTATRAISGSLNAYLRTGSGATGQLLSDLLADASTAIDPKFAMALSIGGASNAVKVVLDMPGAMISVPTIDVQQVVSTTINFTAQGYDPIDATYEIETPNEIVVRYYSN